MNKLSIWLDSYGASTLADKLGVSKSTVSHWRHGRHQVPAPRCREIERLSGGQITVSDLRPDVFGQPLEGEAA